MNNNNIKLAAALTTILACVTPSIGCDSKDSENQKSKTENAALKQKIENIRLRKKLEDLQRKNNKRVHKSIDAGAPPSFTAIPKIAQKFTPKSPAPAPDAGTKPNSKKITQAECRKIRKKLLSELRSVESKIAGGNVEDDPNLTGDSHESELDADVIEWKEQRKKILSKLAMLNKTTCK